MSTPQFTHEHGDAGVKGPPGLRHPDQLLRDRREGVPRPVKRLPLGRPVARTSDHASASGASMRSRSAIVVAQLRIVIDLYAGVPMILLRRLFVRWALRRCE